MNDRVSDAGENDDQAGDEVRLSIPATPELMRLARLTAGGLASRLGFSYDEVEDLRLAIDELCYALVGPDGTTGVLHLQYRLKGPALEVEGVLDPDMDGGVTSGGGPVAAGGSGHAGGGQADAGGEPRLSELASQILSALVDDHAIRRDDRQRPCLWLRKASHTVR